MALIGQSASLLFKIDADSSGAQRELRAVDAAVGRLGGQFSSFAGIASIGAASIAAIGAAAVTASVAMFNLAKSTSEYGSEIFDATQKTGLGAEAISSLKIAAEQSGSSLEAVTRGITIFAKNYKGTSQDLEGELGKLFQKINDAKPGFEQLTLATKNFGRAGGDLIPVIKSFDGNLPALIAKLQKLGVTMTDEDARAADEFGDTLDTLTTQAAAVGRQFATELMPMMTGAMHAISQAMSNNKGVAAEWGQFLVNTVNGVSFTFGTAGRAINDILYAISGGLINNQNQWAVWGHAVRIAAMIATAGLSEMAWAMNKVGIATGGASGSGQGQWLGPSAMAVPPSLTSIKMPGGGGKGGGGGQAPDPEQERQKEIRRIQQHNAQLLDIFKATNDKRIADLDFALSQGFIKEAEHIRDVQALKLQSIVYEQIQLKQMLRDQNLNAEERKDIETKIAVLDKQLAAGKVKLAQDVYEKIKEIAEKDLKEFEEREKKRREEQRRTANERARLEVDPDGGLRDAKRDQFGRNISILGDSPLLIRNEVGNITNTISPMLPMLQLAGQAFGQLAQGIGQVIQNFILMGATGPNAMRKLVASVLAGVSAQAAVMAIMELAYGIAALTPWGAAIYGPAPFHFKAAALFGAVAVGTGILGRAVAGDSFSQQATGGGTGGGGSSAGAGNAPALNFTSPFAGFQQQNSMMLGAVADELRAFREQFGVASPGDVVMRGAGAAAPAIFGAYQDVLRDDPKAATTQRRNQGDYRS